MASTPEQRYLKLFDKRPELFQRAPPYQLASFIGVKPEYPSRVGSRMVKERLFINLSEALVTVFRSILT